jgi:hypothetical protein
LLLAQMQKTAQKAGAKRVFAQKKSGQRFDG